MAKKIIYFLCTGNSARSQIAAGLAKKHLGDEYEVHSAGVETAQISPFALRVMDEIGIDISGETSKLVHMDILNKADVLVTLCKDAYERCPIVPNRPTHLHWGIEDPAAAEGSDEEKLAIFRETRDELEELIKRFDAEGVQDDITYISRETPFYEQKNTFGETLTSIRKEQGKSRAEFAQLLDVNELFLEQAENNQFKPSKDFVHRLALNTGKDYEDLVRSLYILN